MVPNVRMLLAGQIVFRLQVIDDGQVRSAMSDISKFSALTSARRVVDGAASAHLDLPLTLLALWGDGGDWQRRFSAV